jgi:hypothetical protein
MAYADYLYQYQARHLDSYRLVQNFKFLKTQISRRRWFILRRGGVSKKPAAAAAFGGGVHHCDISFMKCVSVF